MKIVCDKCQAKYSIADEKVRGKTFKIRCKKCSNVIIVRDKAGAEADAGGDAGGAPADDPAAAAAAAAPGWHLAVGGETVGPVPEEDVRARYDRGEIDKETAVWQEGFEDWVPLADVPLFADLPDQPAGGGAAVAAAAGLGAAASAGADDPFGSGGDDAFAGGGDDAFGGGSEPAGGLGGGGLGGGGLGGGASAPAESPASPRVNNLTGARNENSVLFSLDNLQAMAAGGGSSTPAPKGPAKVATSAPTSEGSGLIDIRAMGSLMDSGSGGGGGPDFGGGGGGGGSSDGGAAPLPSFGGGGFGGLSAQPLVTTPPEEEATPAAPPPPPKSNVGLYIVVGILALGLLGLGGYIITRPPPEPQKETVVVEKQVMMPGVAESDKDEDDKDEKDKDEEEDKDEADTDGEDTDGMEDELGADGKPTGKKKKKKKKSGTSTASTSGSSGGSDPAPKEEPKKPTNSADDVDCLLDPSLAKCKGGGSKPKSSGGSSGGSSAPANAPEKLSPSDLSAGIAPVKAAASACKSKGGVPPGTKVPIKLSIKGSTGAVISASAQGEFASTGAATCAAKELKKAKFKQFKASQMGFTYKVKM